MDGFGRSVRHGVLSLGLVEWAWLLEILGEIEEKARRGRKGYEYVLSWA